MVNFIVCDDNKSLVKNICNIINKCMINNDIEYKIHEYYDYDSKFQKIINQKLPSKIYMLDIETPSGSGIDIARQIRVNDLNSVIIFLTGHNELGDIILKNDLLFLSFINKFDNYQDRLTNSINQSLKIIGQRQILNFKDNNIIYTISLNDIYYIYKDKKDRKTVIVTDYKDFTIGKHLKDLQKELNSDFIYSHKSCIVNRNKILMIDKSKREIILTNGKNINIVSKKFLSEY